MPPEAIRWICLTCVGIMAWFMLSISDPSVSIDETKVDLGLKLPPPISDYHLPPDIRDPFRKAVDNGLLIEKDFLKKGGTAAAGKGGPIGKAGKAPVQHEIEVHLEGIIWDPVHPSVSINGNLYSEGDKIGGIQALHIYPDRVILKIGNKEIEKRIEAIR